MHLYSKKISKFNNLVCGTLVGDFGLLQFTKDLEEKEVVKNRKRFFKEFKIDLSNTVFQEQTHSANIRVVSIKDRGRGAYSSKGVIEENDALISNEENLFLCSYTADCVPISFFHPKSHAFGIAHAGWRGTLDLIAQETARKLNKTFGANYSSLVCYLGPSIGKCCYEVSRAKDHRIEGFIDKFGEKVILKRGNRRYLDLTGAIIIQLQELGISAENIEISNICTCCNKKYNLPSYYREKDNLERSLLSIIGIHKN